MPGDHASSFWENGFLFPVDIFTSQEAETLLKNYHRYLKMYGSGPRGQRRIRGNRIFRLHLVADWAMKIVRHPQLVAAVSAVLGSPNLLCWSSDLCVKPAGSSDCFGWHQDEAYADLAPHTQVLTAWVAITRADRDNASVKYIRQGTGTDGGWADRHQEKNVYSLATEKKDFAKKLPVAHIISK